MAFGDFLVVLVLERVQVLIDQHNGIVQRFQLGKMIAVGVLAIDSLQVVQLGQQAFAQVARAYTDGVHLLDHVDGFTQGIAAERHAGRRGARWNERGTRRLRPRRLDFRLCDDSLFRLL